MGIEYLCVPGPILGHQDGTANLNDMTLPTRSSLPSLQKGLADMVFNASLPGPQPCTKPSALDAAVNQLPQCPAMPLCTWQGPDPTPMKVPFSAWADDSSVFAYTLQGGGRGSLLHGVSYVHTGQL